jgi:hypothetical protein
MNSPRRRAPVTASSFCASRASAVAPPCWASLSASLRGSRAAERWFARRQQLDAVVSAPYEPEHAEISDDRASHADLLSQRQLLADQLFGRARLAHRQLRHGGDRAPRQRSGARRSQFRVPQAAGLHGVLEGLLRPALGQP